eukprot:gene20970-27826_t
MFRLHARPNSISSACRGSAGTPGPGSFSSPSIRRSRRAPQTLINLPNTDVGISQPYVSAPSKATPLPNGEVPHETPGGPSSTGPDSSHGSTSTAPASSSSHDATPQALNTAPESDSSQSSTGLAAISPTSERSTISLQVHVDREQRILTSRLQQAKSPEHILAMFNQVEAAGGEGIINQYHLTCAFSRLASLHAADPAEASSEASSKVMGTLARLVSKHHTRFDPRAATNILYAAVKLYPSRGNRDVSGGGAPSGDVGLQVIEAAMLSVRGQLRLMKNLELANMLWSLSKLGVQPGEEWMTEFWERLYSMNPQDFSNLLHAVTGLGLQPGDDWLDSFLLHSKRKLHSFEPQHFAGTLHALGKFQDKRFEEWLPSFFKASLPDLSTWSPHCLASAELCMVLGSLAQLGIKPRVDWLEDAYTASLRHIQSGNPRDITTLSSALVALDPSLDFHNQGSAAWALQCMRKRSSASRQASTGSTEHGQQGVEDSEPAPSTRADISRSGDREGMPSAPAVPGSLAPVGRVSEAWLYTCASHIRSSSESFRPSQLRYALTVLVQLKKPF